MSKDLLEEELESSEFKKKRLENDKQVFVVAILSLFLWIPIGTIMAVFSLIRANEELDDYRINPHIYTDDSYQKIKTGRKIAIISLLIQIISIPAFIIMTIFLS
jgi:hypothetical protein